MDQLTNDQIRIRAHQLWEQAGRPEGQEQEFWYQAERELRPGNGSKSKDGVNTEEKAGESLMDTSSLAVAV